MPACLALRVTRLARIAVKASSPAAIVVAVNLLLGRPLLQAHDDHHVVFHAGVVEVDLDPATLRAALDLVRVLTRLHGEHVGAAAPRCCLSTPRASRTITSAARTAQSRATR